MYPGDTLQKRIARFYAHVYALRLVGSKAAQYFLCSHEGGDISTLRGLGVDDWFLSGWDQDEEALKAASAKHNFPGKWLHVGNIAYAQFGSPSHVFLDFCSQISPLTISTARACWSRMSKGSVLSVTFLKGREAKDERNSLETLKNECTWLTPGQRRTILLARSLSDYQILGCIEYQSQRSNSLGSPMVICQFRKGSNVQTFGYGTIVLDESKAREERNRIIQDYSPKHAALLLNTTPRHIAAWKAVATRSRA